MRFLGIDYGTKRIGIAVSDKNGKFAFPHSIIQFSTSQAVNSEIKKICEKNDVSKIILGKPGGYKGDAGEILKKIENFKKKLEEYINISVFYESEVLTTQQAKRPYGDKKGKKIDASAAALILQSWLDKKQVV